MNFYRWDNQASAQAALDYVNGHETFPYYGANAATREEARDKQKTVKWCDKLIECTDGKWAFPQIPTEKLDAMGVTQEEREQFIEAFQPSIEQYDPAWIPILDYPES